MNQILPFPYRVLYPIILYHDLLLLLVHMYVYRLFVVLLFLPSYKRKRVLSSEPFGSARQSRLRVHVSVTRPHFKRSHSKDARTLLSSITFTHSPYKCLKSSSTLLHVEEKDLKYMNHGSK